MFVVLMLLCIPMLVLSIAGNRIDNEFYNDDATEKDLNYLEAILTVGNLGTDRVPLSLRYKCKNITDGVYIAEGRCGLGILTIAGFDIDMTDVSQVFQFCDLAMVLVFFAYCMYFAMRVNKVRKDTDQRQLTVADYALSVEGFPPETQREDIRGDSTSCDRPGLT